jgi:hypothetical protein
LIPSRVERVPPIPSPFNGEDYGDNSGYLTLPSFMLLARGEKNTDLYNQVNKGAVKSEAKYD